MQAETPTITSMSYAAATQQAGLAAGFQMQGKPLNIEHWNPAKVAAAADWRGVFPDLNPKDKADFEDALDAAKERRIGGGFGKPLGAIQFDQVLKETHELIEKAKERAMTTRLVKVFIVDPEESLPLENRLLYKSEEFLTDSTDTELFFDIDIKGILEAHNKVRLMTIDKKTAKGADKPQRLDPAKVRDLKMQVVVLLSF